MGKQYAGLGKLGVLFVLFPMMIWGFALRKTFGLWDRYTTQQNKIEQMRDDSLTGVRDTLVPDRQIALLGDGRLLGGMEAILERERVNVVSFTPVIVRQERGHTLYAGEWVLSGDFAALLRFLYRMEKDFPAVKPVSAAFRVSREERKAAPRLRLTLIVMQLFRKE